MWTCASISEQTASENRLVYENADSVRYKEVTNGIMRLRMNDGNYYTSASPLVFSFANAIGDLGLDTGSENSDTWYYLYAIPAGANTFTITASIRSPVDITPGPLSSTIYKYIGAFMNRSDNNILSFSQLGAEKFLFSAYRMELDVAGSLRIPFIR